MTVEAVLRAAAQVVIVLSPVAIVLRWCPIELSHGAWCAVWLSLPFWVAFGVVAARKTSGVGEAATCGRFAGALVCLAPVAYGADVLPLLAIAALPAVALGWIGGVAAHILLGRPIRARVACLDQERHSHLLSTRDSHGDADS